MTFKSDPSFGKMPDGPQDQSPNFVKGCGIGCLSVIVIAVIIGVIIGFASNSPEKDAKNAETRISEISVDECRSAVEANLKSPATAEFSDERISGVGSNRTVTGDVDSQNSFGALVRSTFTCDVTVANDVGTVTDVSIR